MGRPYTRSNLVLVIHSIHTVSAKGQDTGYTFKYIPLPLNGTGLYSTVYPKCSHNTDSILCLGIIMVTSSIAL